MIKKNLLWIRRDLRTIDCDLIATLAQMSSVNTFEGVFIAEALQSRSSTQAWFIEQNINSLSQKLSALGVKLHFLTLNSGQNYFQALEKFFKDNSYDALYYSQYTSDSAIDLTKNLSKFVDVSCQHRLKGNYLFDLGTIRNSLGRPFLKFTPFLKEVLSRLKQKKFTVLHLNSLKKYDTAHKSASKKFYWPSKTRALDWLKIGEDGAEAHLKDVLKNRLNDYDERRNFPGIEGTSRLSAYLNIGSLGVNHVVQSIAAREKSDDPNFFSPGAQSLLSEIIWREFFHHLFWDFPQLYYGAPFKSWAENLEYDKDVKNFELWSKGETGFPIVDAAMHQLNQTGWMHNRLRMVVASFLSKNLSQDWRLGEQYFLEHLVDADIASNNGGWQWASSVGVDSTPYFRIFSPTLQQKKFDPDGRFIYQELPLLESVPLKYLSDPYVWLKKNPGLEIAYPRQIIDLNDSRTEALERYRLAQKM